MKNIAGAIAVGFAMLLLMQVAGLAEDSGAPGSVVASPAAVLADLQKRESESKLGHLEKAAAFKSEYEVLASAHADSEEGLEATLWLLRNTWWEREAGTMEESAAKIADQIMERYFESPKLAKLPEYYYVLSSEKRNELYTKLAKDSPVPVVRAAALFTLGRSEVRAKDEATQKLGRERLALIISDYADEPYRLTTYGVVAEAVLHPHDPAALEIDRPAPEIIGADYLGKPMKLSDYRGKIVVLDFWGDW